jgi:hypothetical protein
VKKNSQILIAVSTVAVFAAAPLAARATDVAAGATVTATLQAHQPYTLPLSLTSAPSGGSGTMSPQAATMSAAGIYNFTETDTNGVFGPPNTVFQAVCIGLTPGATYGQAGMNFTIEPLFRFTPPDSIVSISAHQAGAIAYLAASSYLPAPSDPNLATDAATFQMAVWDLLYTPGYVPPSPIAPRIPTIGYAGISDQTIANAAGEAAQAWDATWMSSYMPPSDIFALAGTGAAGGQTSSFVALGPAAIVAPVPLPASAGVGFATLGGFGILFLVRRRLTRRPQIAWVEGGVEMPMIRPSGEGI